jgi:hypothetical protein
MDELSQRIATLESQLKQISSPPLPAIVPRMYLVASGCIFIGLLVLQPMFIRTEVRTDNQFSTRFSVKKFLTFWLILSALASVGIFGLQYKK